VKTISIHPLLKTTVMASSMNRRAWLKTTSMFTGSIAFLSGTLNSLKVSAAPAPPIRIKRLTDADIERAAPPDLKARLFANENPFGPSDKAKQAIAESLSTSFQYPFMYSNQLMEKIKEQEGLMDNMVILGAGSSPILSAAAMYFSKGGGSIISGDPSYEDLPSRAPHFGGKWVKVPLTTDYKLDLDAMEKAIDSTTKLVYICNPNNPTGTVLDTAKLKDFCERVSKKVAVFIDEAYIDYLPDPQNASLIDCVKKGQNVIVARTFSKLYGFAGLRVGYAIAQPETVKNLDPYCTGEICMSAPSIRAALATYQEKDFLQSALQKTIASRDYLYKVLKEEGYDYIPSSTNFVMFPIKMDGKRFDEEMKKRGVGIRYWKFNNKNWCRVSIGRMDEMEAFAAAFKEIS
jgi:histidinol-phosphate aminotransferase